MLVVSLAYHCGYEGEVEGDMKGALETVGPMKGGQSWRHSHEAFGQIVATKT